jgi:predicted phosphoribosyltransferase
MQFQQKMSFGKAPSSESSAPIDDITLPYLHRRDGGRALSQFLCGYKGQRSVVVLALPRGGVPVGFEVAQALEVPLDVFVVRKLGVPEQEELAMGAIASNGARVLNAEVLQALHISSDVLEAVTHRERLEMQRREQLYRGDRAPLSVRGQCVIVVDDGLATGSTMLAAVRALRQQDAAHIVVAVPVAAAETCRAFREEVDEIVCAATPHPFRAVGLWYQDFSETSDSEVRELLARAGSQTSGDAVSTQVSAVPRLESPAESS